MAEIHTLLGVSTIAPLDVMKKAYRAAAKKLHPDHGGSTEQFQKLSALWAAYLKQSTPGATGMQDYTRGHQHNPQQQQAWNGFGSFNTDDVFRAYGVPNPHRRRYSYTKKDHI